MPDYSIFKDREGKVAVLPSNLAANFRPPPKPTFGGGKRDRTADPLLAKQVLSQLSYTPVVASTMNAREGTQWWA